ncbi:MAG: hypothetical protein J6P44_09495 [Bacteroidales bacterium]|nr:hypothetical protein [Bacteroidales bacterium]
MKKVFLTLGVVVALFAFASCGDKDCACVVTYNGAGEVAAATSETSVDGWDGDCDEITVKDLTEEKYQDADAVTCTEK